MSQLVVVGVAMIMRSMFVKGPRAKVLALSRDGVTDVVMNFANFKATFSLVIKIFELQRCTIRNTHSQYVIRECWSIGKTV